MYSGYYQKKIKMATVGEENGKVGEDLETIQERHKKENKDLLAKIQALKHSVPKGDQKKKKAVALEIAKLEADQEERHKREIEELKAQIESSSTESDVSERLQDINISAQPEETGNKSSRAEKRRAKKAAKEQERERRIAEAELENVNCARNVEMEKMKNILQERNLEIYEITPDGHCLYNAVADQLKRKNLESDYQQLRQQVSEYMSSHSSDFLPFLVHSETGELYTPDEFTKYCQDIAETSAWGGQLELQALSHILRMPIKIIQADAPVIRIGEDFKTSPIMLSYHHHAYGLGEHYNSLIPTINEDEQR